MPKATAAVDPEKCQPYLCGAGVCPAARECPHRILRQEAPLEIPFVHGDSSLCRGCFRCLKACPFKAIRKV